MPGGLAEHGVDRPPPAGVGSLDVGDGPLAESGEYLALKQAKA